MGHDDRYTGPEPNEEACSNLWRSEKMDLVSIHVQREVAHDTILALGKLGVAQFRDLNQNQSTFTRQFTGDVRTCEDAERRIRFFEDQLRRNNSDRNNLIPEVPLSGREEEEMAAADSFDNLIQRLEQLETELKESNANYETLLQQKFSALEYLEVLSQDRSFFRGEAMGGGGSLMDEGGDSGLSSRTSGLRYVAGVMDESKQVLFERLLYRVTRGNMFFRTAPTTHKEFVDPATGQKVEKLVFVVFFGARRAEEKIRKICESQQINIYPYNIDTDQREEIKTTEDRQFEVQKTIERTEVQRQALLTQLKENIFGWKKIIITEKSIYNILNFLSFEGQMVRAEAWVPARDLDSVRRALQSAKIESSGHKVESVMEEVENPKLIKPTYFRTNKVVANFQAIVDSYGMARYKEVNPGVLTVVTFPFLFGIMFGDVGHAFIMFLFASFLIIFEKKLLKTKLNEIIEMVFQGRYVVFFMSIFAFWTGLLYNDMFGIMIAPFGGKSFWAFPETAEEAAEICDPTWGAPGTEEVACRIKGASVYPFGIDPSWSETSTKLAFMNSLKMKMAVILGVGQMFIGEICQLMNHIRTGDKKQIWFRWLPEVVFLLFTFGYMDVMIVIKWLTNWGVEMKNGHGPPLLLGTMTDFFLSMGAVAPGSYLYGSDAGQTSIQTVLLLCAVLSVPLLLLVIPYLEKKEHDKSSKYHGQIGDEEEDEEEAHWDFSEIVIHQIIHTIEYVLGCVSNTASYLRLWALSLAHAELSEVFWSFAWMIGLNADSGNGVAVFLFWSVWFAVTIGVLLLMESLSAFLHALRLHWVEFNNKYYYGDGYKFAPYSVEELVPKGFVYTASFKEDL